MLVEDKNEIIEFFRNRGISLTKPRVEIGCLLLRSHRHLTSSQIVNMVYQSIPSASRATIFNTLNLFLEHGLIQKLDIPMGKSVYDTNMSPHHHIYDEKTGDIVDIHLSDRLEEELRKDIVKKAPLGYKKSVKSAPLQITVHINSPDTTF